MVHLGDITKIRGSDAAPVNVVIGGSPCQDLSVAGKRAGLGGERSGLFMDQIRVIKEMREHDADANGRTGGIIRPRYMVWENVPGAFSSNGGEDFGVVLQETVRVVAKEAPAVPVPAKGWPTAGCLAGVGDGGDCFTVAWRVFDAQFWGVPQHRRRIALVADFGGTSAPEILFERESVSGDPTPGGEEGQAITGDAEGCIAKTGGGELTRQRGDATRGGRAFAAGFNGWKSVSGSIQYSEGKSPTIEANMPPDVVLAVDENQRSEVRVGKNMGALTTGGAVRTFAQNGFQGDYTESGTASTLKKQRDYKDATDLIVVENGAGALNCMHEQQAAMTVGALCADDYKGINNQYVEQGKALLQDSVVRRLTPLECERLQGFPDGWTDIGPWAGADGKLRKESSDAARYRALGNSIALPPWTYVLQRLSLACGLDRTMASLFDGIGGFPLIWEGLNGPGSCLWASEIEDFPIAVTERRFNGGKTG